MVKKIVLSLIAVLGVCAMALSQNKQISGTVTGPDGNPIAGASVMVDGTSTGTTTGADGKFAFSAPTNGTLSVSFIGYEAQTIAIAGKTSFRVSLKEDTQAIDDVTIIAYGAKRKQDLVGSVSKVNAGLIKNSQASSVSKALEGAVAGLQVLSSTGQPGSDASIVIRGIGSLSGSNTALIVVDGVPFNGSLSDINSADIESMSVSKDAVSNSLYGSRAANGVVLIKTKTGKKDRTNVSFQGSWGVNTRAFKDYDMATSSAEFYELSWYGLRNTQWATGVSLGEANLYATSHLLSELGDYNAFKIPAGQYLVGTNGKLNPQAVQRYDDSFADAMFGSSFRQEYIANVSGASDKTDYYLSVGYLDDQSYIVGSSYDRVTARANVNTRLYKWLKVGMNLSYSTTTSKGVQEGTGLASNPFDVARSWAPIYPVHAYDLDGNVKLDKKGNPMYDNGQAGTTDGAGTRPVATNQNVICNLHEDIRKSVYHNLSSRMYAEVKFLRDFTFTVNYSYDYKAGRGTTYYTPTIGDGAAFGGRSTKASNMATTSNFNQILVYNKSIGDHNIEAKVGHEYYVYDSEYLSGQKTNFFDPMNPELDNGGAMISLSSSTSNHNIEGYFFSADYDYAHKYYISGAFRRDGTSRFLNRWGNFWSVGGAWRISAENFMQGATWVNDLKIRASYGTQGNEDVLNYTPYVDQYSITWDGTALGSSPSFYGNPDLTWEKQKTFDVGVDFRFWDRFFGSIDYFRRRTDDMLFQKTLAASAGRPYNWENLGAMRNTGIEFELGVDIFKKQDLRWTINVIGSHYENTIITLPEENREAGIVSGNFKMMEGQNRYEYYIRRYAGMDEKGHATWYTSEKDEKGNPTGVESGVTTTYSDADKFYIGKSALPSFTGGVNTSFYFKGFDLMIATAFQIGGWAYDYSFLSGMSNSFYVGHNRELWNTWNPETATGKYPLWNANENSNSYGQTSDAHLLSASYFSIRNITAGYTFPVKWMKKLGIQSIRVFLAVDNVALWSKRQGFDPRVSLSGSNGSFGGYSPLRTISGGINLNF